MNKVLERIFLVIIVCSTGIIHPLTVQAQEVFSEEKAFVYMLKASGMEYQSFVDEYLFRFKSNSYRSYAEDEFEVHKLNGKLGSTIASVSNDKEFYLEISSAFGEYDFDQNLFNFQPFIEVPVLDVMDYLFASRFETNSQVSVKLLNGTEINGLPMEYEKANFLVKMRKNQKTGKVDRNIFLRIYFKLDGNIEITEQSTAKRSATLAANITHIEIYDSREYTSAPLANITSEFAILEKAKKELSAK